MRVVFVSFDRMGWACLDKILALGGNVVAVVTLEDQLLEKRSGFQGFEDMAGKAQAPLLKCKNINQPEIIDALAKLQPDLIFIIGWSQLVKPEFIRLAKDGVLGMHPTLLPKHRGRAPLPWAVIFGLKKTGVSLFYIAEEADNGDLVGQAEVPIGADDTAQTLFDCVLQVHVDLIEEYFPKLASGTAPRIQQDPTRASHWEKRTPKDGIIDWYTDAPHLYDWVRALSEPYPGAFTFCRKGKLFAWTARIEGATHPEAKEGEILQVSEAGIVVNTGEGGLLLTRVQLEGGPMLEGGAIHTAKVVQVGEVLG